CVLDVGVEFLVLALVGRVVSVGVRFPRAGARFALCGFAALLGVSHRLLRVVVPGGLQASFQQRVPSAARKYRGQSPFPRLLPRSRILVLARSNPKSGSAARNRGQPLRTCAASDRGSALSSEPRQGRLCPRFLMV